MAGAPYIASKKLSISHSLAGGDSHMYKTLSPKALGISGRQSELIELALTYGFRGLDVDMADLAKRARSTSIEHALRFLESAKIKIGTYDLPVNLRGDDANFTTQLGLLAAACEVATVVKAQRCIYTVAPAHDELPFQPNFELHRKRLGQVAEILAKYDIQLGIGFQAAPAAREGKQHQFIHQAENLLTLVKTIGVPNVGVMLDTWNWFVGGGGIDQIGELGGEQIVAVRLADYPAGSDVARIAEKTRSLPLEDGTVDCQAIVNLLVEKEFSGPVTLYPHPSTLRGATRESIVQRAANTLEDLWRGAGLSKSRAPIGPLGSHGQEGEVEEEELEIEVEDIADSETETEAAVAGSEQEE
jgi:sugar phosphate isomerase/epimerase